MPIFEDDRLEAARQEVELRRVGLLRQWIDQGWWTGLDIGRLAFTRGEVVLALGSDGPGMMDLLGDDRWYHALDKGYQGRAVYDPDKLGTSLARWFTKHRFEPLVVESRLLRAQSEVLAAERHIRASIDNEDSMGATTELRSAVKWLQTWMLEGWGKRDSSQGRLGTRFEHLAMAHGHGRLADTLNELSALDATSVKRRMAAAPAWVQERHDRSWRARRHVDEDVSRLQDIRDTLRVCSLYAARRLTAQPFPGWLAIPTESRALTGKTARLSALIDELFAETP